MRKAHLFLIALIVLPSLAGCSNWRQPTEPDPTLPPLEIVEIDKQAAGFSTLPTSNLSAHTLNARVGELLRGGAYLDADYDNGIRMQSIMVILTESFADPVIDEIAIGTPVADVKKALGEPSSVIDGADLIFYKGNEYLIGFKGSEKVDYAVVSHLPQAYDPDILRKIIASTREYKSPEGIANDPDIFTFFEKSTTGDHFTCESLNGIYMTYNQGYFAISVYNNFEGRLFVVKNDNVWNVIHYVNQDYCAVKMNSLLNAYIRDKTAETAGEAVPATPGT